LNGPIRLEKCDQIGITVKKKEKNRKSSRSPFWKEFGQSWPIFWRLALLLCEKGVVAMKKCIIAIDWRCGLMVWINKQPSRGITMPFESASICIQAAMKSLGKTMYVCMVDLFFEIEGLHFSR
jgi:hypothetical protein